MEVSRGSGQGSTVRDVGWLLITVYALEAMAFVGVVFLGAVAASPDDEKQTA